MAQWYTFVYFSEIRAYRVAIHEEFDWDLVEMRFLEIITGANFAFCMHGAGRQGCASV